MAQQRILLVLKAEQQNSPVKGFIKNAYGDKNCKDFQEPLARHMKNVHLRRSCLLTRRPRGAHDAPGSRRACPPRQHVLWAPSS